MNRPRTRIHVASAILAATFALFVAATAARAASPDFAAVTWVPQCGVDPVGDESPASADLVGDAANPSTYTGQDASFIYFRYRLNGNPAGSGSNPFVNVAWVSLLNVPSGNPFRYQYLLALNGDLGTIELWSNNPATATDIDFTPLFNDPAETKLFSQVYNVNAAGINTSPLARIVGPLTSTFGGNADYFIEVAYPISVLISNGVIANAGELASVRYFLATSANSNNYNKDSECQFVPQTTLGITKSVTPSSIPVNGTTPISYTITVANSGNANATGVVIDDTTLPSYMTGINVTVSSSSPSVSWTIVSTNPLKVKVNSMPPGATVTVRITANASPHCADANFTNTATAVAINADEVSASALLTITKNAPEICNGIDDNCDGQVDEGGSALCDDGNACTQTDTCAGAAGCQHSAPITCNASDQCHNPGVCQPSTGTCSNPPKQNGVTCDDGNGCTQTDTCQAGVCTGGNGVVCSASDQCHVAGVCDTTSGLCSNPTKTNGTACGDGNACTDGDTCQAGSCQSGTPKVCAAQDQCHVAGTCDTTTGQCSSPSKPNGSTCNDGDACTQTDTCQSGTCTGSNDKTCTALDQCHVAGICDPGNGTCSNPTKANGTTCSDGNACTQDDTCQNGSCNGADPVVCAALDQCHDVGICDTGTGVCSNPTKTNGTACDDGNLCTQSDTCQAGSCTGTNPVTCSAQDQCHAAGVCDPTTGSCSNPAKANGTTCNDGNACTQDDTCQNGSCNGADPVVCAALDQCHDVGICNTGTGACSNPTKTNGTTCNDGNLCTQTDTCQSGTCTGTSPVTCSAQDDCHQVGTCDPTTGVCSNPTEPDGTGCNAGNQCATHVCQAGVCNLTSSVTCPPTDQCHSAGTCNPQNGTCSNPSKPDGSACNDGNQCTQSDTCQTGSCTGTNPVVCSAQDQCHVPGVCDPDLGTCTNPSKPNGTTCSDGNACTQDDTCQNGSCNGADSVICAALDQCHDVGICNTGTGVCSNPSKTNGTACNDGDLCTQTDTCQGGSCTGSNEKTCTALNPCHDPGSCNPITGACSNPPKSDGTSCVDGNACTQSDTCQAGSCEGAFPVVCPDPDQCHTPGTCNPLSGTCSNPTAQNGTQCTDGNGCTQTDTCQNGNCQGSNPVVCTVLDQCHLVGACDPDSGTCSNPAKPNGTQCIDGDKCTTIDVCQSGICFGTTPVVCTASDQCHDAGACDPATGTCSDPAVDNGTPCNDLNACTLNEACLNGNCTGGTQVVCNDNNPCTIDACNPSSDGGCFVSGFDNAAPCSDGDSCTIGDHCAGGTCQPGSTTRNCDDGKVCTSDQCVPNQTDCFYTNLETPCSDGNNCTDGDVCGGGTCNPGTPVTCNDQNPCTDDSCVAPGGCVYTNDNTNTCSDGDNCTAPDHCQNGSCVTSDVDCDDHDECTTDSCDDQGGGFLCKNPRCNLQPGAVPGPDCPTHCFPPCGNHQVDPGETCDPPDLTPDPLSGQPKCRLDCTSCGDGVKQSGEDCDDGKANSDQDGLCNGLKPVDQCLNVCKGVVCKDPALIKFATPLNLFKFHGQLVTDATLDFAGNHLVIELQDANKNVLFRSSLLAGNLIAKTPTTFLYKDTTAKVNGGMYKVRLKQSRGSYKAYIQTYGDLSLSVADMITNVYGAGTNGWAVRGIWTPITGGWKLSGKNSFLPVP